MKKLLPFHSILLSLLIVTSLFSNIEAQTVASATQVSNSTTTNAYPSLSLEMLFFKVKQEGTSIQASWTTDGEKNTAYFALERSYDKTTFYDVGMIPAQGNSSDLQKYTETDNPPQDGLVYYRINMTDEDGTSARSEVIAIEYKSGEYVVPNTNTNAILDMNTEIATPIKVELVDAFGENVASFDYPAKSRYLNIDFSDYSTGYYTLRITSDFGTKTKNIIYVN